MTQPVDIEALRQLMERATPGPWLCQGADEADMFVPIIADNLGGLVGGAMLWPTEIDQKYFDRAERNAQLIVAAVNALPSLLTELEALRAERGRMVEGLQDARAEMSTCDASNPARHPGEQAMTVEVTQEDREAAASLIAWHNKAASDWKTEGGNDLTFFAASMPDGIRKGIWDGHDVVQILARHRIASTRAAAERIAELEGALEPFVSGACHTMVFLQSREKMHSCGIDLYREDVERARTALQHKEPKP